ncbi:MAG TPA: hypothetical protein VFZ67_05200 [Nitrososphaera sp.]
MSAKSSNLLNKKVIIVIVLVAGILSAILIASSVVQTRAQQQMSWREQELPEINGSVNVGNEIRDFVNQNVNVSFVTAAENAQSQVTNGTVIGGHLGVVQGYLVYRFLTVNAENQTGYITLIDAGNGNELYTSQGQPSSSFNPIFGHQGLHGFGGGQGPWKVREWGIWH